MNLIGFPRPLREVVQRWLQQLRSPPGTSQSSQDEDTVGLLFEKERSAPNSSHLDKYVNRKSAVTLASLGILLLLTALGLSTKYARVEELAPKISTAPLEDHYLHIVLPAQSSYAELCKTMLTGFVLSYPPPWVAIPKPTIEESGQEFSAVYRRIESILEFLEHEDGRRDNDTAIILGNPNTWFQVKPEVLLKRYMSIQHRHELQIMGNFGNTTAAANGIKSRVLFASSATCQSDDNHCPSILSSSGTPRYLSHDFTIGQVKDLTPLYKRALEQARLLDGSGTTFDETSIFGGLFRRQEVWRKSLAKMVALHSKLDLNDLDQQNFGITIDADSELSHLITGDDSGDSTWTKPDFQIDDHGGLPRDIAMSAPPYWTVTGDLPSKTWKQVPLLVANQKVPALIQRPSDIAPELSHAWYERLWFHPYSRALLDSEVLTSILPIARLVDPRTGIRQRFWAQGIGKASVKTVDVEIYEWKDICGDAQVAEEVFLDGKGVWKDPRL